VKMSGTTSSSPLARSSSATTARSIPASRSSTASSTRTRESTHTRHAGKRTGATSPIVQRRPLSQGLSVWVSCAAMLPLSQ
jgi:hypothetical protein